LFIHRGSTHLLYAIFESDTRTRYTVHSLLFRLFGSILHRTKAALRLIPVTSNLRYMHGVLNVDEIKN
jgi:hypothetical protein